MLAKLKRYHGEKTEKEDFIIQNLSQIAQGHLVKYHALEDFK